MKFLLLFVFFLPVSIQAQTILIRHANIIDVRSGSVLENIDVFIEKNKIAAVGKNLKHSSNSLLIEAKGKYLIPGLWDMHAHVLNRWDRAAPLYVVNGVTAVRDMATFLPIEEIKNIKLKVLQGSLLGPRFIAGGPLLDGATTRFPKQALLIPTKERAIVVADSLKQEGVDFYKVYETLPRDAFYVFIQKGKEYHLPVTGHVPASITREEASNAGMKSIEHVKFVPSQNKRIADSISALFRNATWDMSRKDTVAAINKNQQGIQLAALFFKEEDAVATGKLFVKNNTWITPTMVQSLPGHYNKEELLQDKTWIYMPASIVAAWRGRLANEKQLMRGDDSRFAELELKTVGGFHKAAVKFLAGTDANDAFIGNIPGFSLHEEMQLFVTSGLSNLEALQTATINPAIYMEATDSLGSIEKNKIADIVILNANPLEEISNSKKIYGVILNGLYLDRKKLDEIFDKVKVLVQTK